ncbi:MAG: hypothetical protein D6734_12330 [Candidatus Schekmanbacteria bacterium]|nr:MAG: hypothetical protein D6734_12330 [Candidatus Schekmanbacteria bacterium]
MEKKIKAYYKMIALIIFLFQFTLPSFFMSAQAQEVECAGLKATIVGTDGNDVITGTYKKDVIAGLGGNDYILGKGGDDIICGGDGQDILVGNDGNDKLYGEGDNDMLVGNDGNDLLNGGEGIDVADGGIGVDRDFECENVSNTGLKVFHINLKADDGTPLEGALFVPKGKVKKVAVLVTHGTFGTYKKSFAGWVGYYWEPYKVVVLSLNRRDNGPTEGGGKTLFEDAVMDLKPGIDFLEKLGFNKVYVMGHSKGTQMAAIYPVLSKDKRVVAVGTYGTVANGRESIEYAIFGNGLLEKNEKKARELVKEGRGNELYEFMTHWGQKIKMTPSSFLSYYGKDTLSIVEREAEKLKIPYLIMWCQGDDVTPGKWSERLYKHLKEKRVNVSLIKLPEPTIPNPPPGYAAHRFLSREEETIKSTYDWLLKNVSEAGEEMESMKIPADLKEFDPPLVPEE